jgi:chromosome partitioning protein
MTHIILFGNEKGGSGKTTYALHTIAGLLNMGASVASIDLDERQQSLSRYIENRQQTKEQNTIPLLVPEHFQISDEASSKHAKDYETILLQLLDELQKYDYIVIDAPGSNTKISRFAHRHADTVVTPLNSSFVDVDLLGKINAKDLTIATHGVYSSMYLCEKLARNKCGKKDPDWIVVHSRYPLNDSLNKRNIDFALRCIANELKFRAIKGFSDRSIFKELFLHGLTLLDAQLLTKQIKITPNVVAARQEVRDFLQALNLPTTI